MKDLTNSINDGKRDWEKMTKNVIKESADVSGLGNSTVNSDVSPDVGGGPKTKSGTYALLTANNGKLADLPEFIELRKKLDPLKLNSKKEQVKSTVRKVILNSVDDTTSDVLTGISETISDLESDKSTQIKKANDAIKVFNKTVDDAAKKHTRTIGVAWTALPEIKSPQDLENFVINSSSGLSFINRMAGDVNEIVTNLNEARAKNNVRAVTGDQTVKDDLEELYKWMRNQSNYFFHKTLVDALKTIIISVTRASIIESIQVGLKQKAQRIAASRAAKVKRDASKYQPLEADEWFILIGDEDISVQQVAVVALRSIGRNDVADEIERDRKSQKPKNKPEDASTDYDNESPTPVPVNESSKSGPGKIFTQSNKIIQEHTSDDRIENKKKKLVEGWNAYKTKNKDVKNTQDPEGFSLLMG